MPNVTRQATSDLSNTGGFTTAPLFSKINDNSDATLIVGVTQTGGRATFGFTAFALPDNAAVSSIDIHYRHRSTTTGTAYAHGSCIKVGATYYGRGETAGWDAGSASGVGSGAAIADVVYSGTLNPATGVAWLYSQVNALTEFGICSNDFNPDANFYQVDITVNYTLVPYDETGKSQIILAVQAKTDIQAALETGKAQVILDSQSVTDGLTADEKNHSQVVAVAQAGADVMQMPELGKTEVILAVQSQADTLVALDALTQTVLVFQSEADVLIPASGGSHVYRRDWPHGNRLRPWSFGGNSQ
jgi:hypothetical protein